MPTFRKAERKIANVRPFKKRMLDPGNSCLEVVSLRNYVVMSGNYVD